MATSVQRASQQLTMADLKGKVDPDWCPGCGDFGVLAAVQKALVELRIPTYHVVTISGIGCSSTFPGYMTTYGMHTLHGRALAVATGLKLANPELIKQGIEHPGFSFLDVFSPCVTYNHDNTYQWFRPRVKKLEEDSAHDPTNWMAAMEKSLLWGEEIPIGKFFERTDVSTLHAAEPVLNNGPLVHGDLKVPPDVARSFVEVLM